MTNRRDFLQTIAASLILPRCHIARKTDHSYYFVNVDSLNSWPVPDPVAWCLQNADQPILERAADRLRKLSVDDGDRIIRLVVRRCRLNLVEVQPNQVVIHHWGHHRADLRPFFKAHRLSSPEIKVTQRDRKKETATNLRGDSFLFGEAIASDFPLEVFQSKWVRRLQQEGDDWQAAPGTSSGFGWNGVQDGSIPWIALKSAWRSSSRICLNCDKPKLLVNFGLRPTGMFNHSPNFISVCGICRRSFRDESAKDVGAWIVANLDAEVRPGFEMRWGRRFKWQCDTILA